VSVGVFHAASVNEIGWYVADADTPTIPIQNATVNAVVALDGATVATPSSSTFVPGLVFPDGKVGGYLLALTAAQITSAGRNYRVTVTVTVGGTLVQTAVLTVPCRSYDGSGS
jgi:hypothetical protein